MVNKSGRSKGCSTCRRRRVKCDENRPICKRCERVNLPCDGPRGTTFVNADKTSWAGKPSCQVPSPPVSLRLVGLHDYVCYARKHLEQGGLIFGSITNDPFYYTAGSMHLDESTPISTHAIVSFATILYGKNHHQPDIAQQGYVMYSTTLNGINAVLSDPKQCTSDAAITTVAVLAIAECLVPSGPSAYLHHMMGLQRLIDMHEPSIFWPSKPYGFRNGVRFMLLLCSLQLQVPCILARDEWKQAMRAACTSKAELREQEIYDVLADCTVLIDRHRHLRLLAYDRDEQIRQIRAAGQTLLLRLGSWRRAWDHEKNNNHGYQTSPMDSDSIPNSSNTLTPYGPVPTSALLMLYNITLIHILQTLAFLPHIPTPNSQPRPQTQPEYQPIDPSLQDNPSEKDHQHYKEHHEDDISISDPSSYPEQARQAAFGISRCVQIYLEARKHIDASAPAVLHWAIATAWGEMRRQKIISNEEDLMLLTGGGGSSSSSSSGDVDGQTTTTETSSSSSSASSQSQYDKGEEEGPVQKATEEQEIKWLRQLLMTYEGRETVVDAGLWETYQAMSGLPEV